MMHEINNPGLYKMSRTASNAPKILALIKGDIAQDAGHCAVTADSEKLMKKKSFVCIAPKNKLLENKRSDKQTRDLRVVL